MRIPPGLYRHRLLHAGLAIVALSVPFWANGYTLHVATMALLHILLAISLNLAMGFAGQLTLAHVAIYGVGAYATANAYDTLGLPYGLALAFGVVFAGAAGVFLGLLASRLKQFYFGIVTLSITMFAHWFFIHGGDLTRGASGWVMDKPEFVVFSAPVGIYLTALAFAALVVWTGMNMGCGPFGRQLAALAEIENVCGAFGIDAAALKRRVFILSSMVAGLAGGLLIGVIGIVDPETFHVVNMIVQFLMVILGGLGSIFGGLIGALALTGLWEWVREFQGLWEIALGAILLGFMVGAPYGLYGMLLKWAPGWREPRHAVALDESEKPSPAIARVIAESRSADTTSTSHPAVVVEDVSKHFGGIAALDGVDLDVRQGEIHAVIGPNGSGKSTLINVLSGFVKPDAGSFALFNEDASHFPPHRVARLGVARTYQNFRLIRRLSVLENVLLGANTRDAHGLGSTAVRRASFLRQEAAMVEEAYAALAFVGMDQFAMSGGSELSGGQMRLVEMARAVMARPRLLLLDEPAAGLSLKHVDTAAEVIRRMQSELGVTVILVEHVLTLVMELSDRVTVLNSGSRLAAGTPLEVREMPEVQAAYLGRRTYERVAADVQL